MDAPTPLPNAATSLSDLLSKQREAFARERDPDWSVRVDRIRRIADIVKRHERELVAAVTHDFGHRSSHETRLAELYIVAAEARYVIRHLRRWMKSRRVATPWHLLPASARIIRQPLGVVGVISPWNYPVQLALGPVVAALAAGNRVMLKPSELTPETSRVLAELIGDRFGDDEVAVVQGDAAIGAAFAALPFDHLFFTGSTAVGRRVAVAAAQNLTPVTLELGGKSPAIVDDDADLTRSVDRIVLGKLLNAGQTCIAPDYALVPRSRVDAFVKAARAGVQKLYPNIAANADYSSIVNERHYSRLLNLVEDARQKGARIETLGDAHQTSELPRRLLPTLVTDVTDDMAIMRDEIFGPLLPIETFDTLDQVIAKINARPHPLAMYWFGNNGARRARVLRETLAGGVTVNDTLWHFAHEALPFGGVGASGNGVYHGEFGFATFSRDKPVYFQSRHAPTRLLYPPYGRSFERILTLLRNRNA
jgi:coniferyl-aldehyde dehydrogenase